MKWRLDAGQIEVIDDDVSAMYRAKTAAERIAIATSAHTAARLMIAARVKHLHPDWKAHDVAVEVSRRLTRGTV